MRFYAGAGAASVLRIWIAIISTVVCALLAILAGVLTPWILIPTAFIAVASVIIALWFPQKYTSSIHGTYDTNAIQMKLGVFFKHNVYIPASSLRTLEIAQTPLQRYFKCCTVIMRFAGGAVVVPFVAKELSDKLIYLFEQEDDEK